MRPSRQGHHRARAAGRRPERGITLIEIMVAIIVFGVGVMGLAGSIPFVARLAAPGPSATRARVIAEERIQELEKAGAETALAPCTRSDTVAGGYTREWTITRDSPAPGMTTIAVRVRWTEAGDPRQVMLTASLFPGRL